MKSNHPKTTCAPTIRHRVPREVRDLVGVLTKQTESDHSYGSAYFGAANPEVIDRLIRKITKRYGKATRALLGKLLREVTRRDRRQEAERRS